MLTPVYPAEGMVTWCQLRNCCKFVILVGAFYEPKKKVLTAHVLYSMFQAPTSLWDIALTREIYLLLPEQYMGI